MITKYTKKPAAAWIIPIWPYAIEINLEVWKRVNAWHLGTDIKYCRFSRSFEDVVSYLSMATQMIDSEC